MKNADVSIGGTYLTYIGEELCRVVVIGRRETAYSKRVAYVVRREEQTQALPKVRTPAALRPANPRGWDVV